MKTITVSKYLAIIPTLRDDPLPALASLSAQTVKPACVIVACGSKAIFRKLLHIQEYLPLRIVYVRPDMSEHVGVRVGKAINTALAGVDLTAYDYLLKLDAEVILSRRCIEECIQKNADLVGLGPFMLIRTDPFLRVLHGRWPETPADDAYILYAFQCCGLKVEPMPDSVVILRKGGAGGGWRYYFYRGLDDYKCGINPITIARMTISLIRARHTLLPLFTMFGYYFSLFKGESTYWFAPVIFRKSLVNEIRRQEARLRRVGLKLKKTVLRR